MRLFKHKLCDVIESVNLLSYSTTNEQRNGEEEMG